MTLDSIFAKEINKNGKNSLRGGSPPLFRKACMGSKLEDTILHSYCLLTSLIAYCILHIN